MKTLRYLQLFLIVGLTLLAVRPLAAQRALVQFSGLVMSSDSLMALPYVSVYVKATSLGTITNTKGFFTLVAHPGDTVVFSSIGYQTVSYVVPASLIEPRYSVIQLMTRDTVNLAETVVYPWPSKEQFREAFLSLQIPDDDLERARKNLERETLKEMGESLPQDSDEVLDYYAQSQADKLYYYGQTPPMNIFSPLAWSQFIKAWRNGDFKKK